MKLSLLNILFVFASLGFTWVKPNSDLKLDWNRITDKDYQLSYIKVVYDSSSQYAIDTKVMLYNTNDGARALSKNSVKLLKKMISDTSNFVEDDETSCRPHYFSHAIVVIRNGEIEGLINIGCTDQLWFFEPRCKAGQAVILTPKGMKLKEQLFTGIR